MKMTRPNSTARTTRAALLLLAPLLPIALLFGCANKTDTPPARDVEEKSGAPVANGDTAAMAAHSDSTKKSDTASTGVSKSSGISESSFPEIKYTHVSVSNRAVLDSIHRRFGKTKESSDAFRAITTLNRKEFGYIRVGDTIVTPDSVVSDLRAYSVFPQHYAGAESLPKLILISNKFQCYACYENGHLVRFAACNTGTERKATFPGRYSLNWKERLRISSLNENWKLPFTFNFHLYAGNAFHQFTMPGRPVSHSCVRQFMTDAEWLFNWGEGGKRDSAGKMIPLSGTPVIIIDVFDFSRPRGGPWLELASNRDQTLTLPANPMGVEEAWIPMSQVPTDARGGIPDRERYVTAEDTLRARGVIRQGVSLSASINYNKLRDAKKKKVVKPRVASKPQAAPTAPKVDGE